MKRLLYRYQSKRLALSAFLVCALIFACGLTVIAAESAIGETPEAMPAEAEFTQPYSKEGAKELFPSDVQTIIEDNTRQIIKTYILTEGQNPADIPRDSFNRGGWLYVLTDITEKKTSTHTRSHSETVEINTDTQDLNEIMKSLPDTLDYQGDDGYSGALALNLATVNCEAAGYKSSSYTVSATREYPHLSTSDLSLIPKTITDSGRELHLDGVAWEAQHTVNIDYEDIPESYRAIATYTAKASRSVVTGYITTAVYSGDVSKTVTGDTTYTAYFSGSEENPAKKMPASGSHNISPLLALITLVVIAALAAAGFFFFPRHNVRVYRDNFRVLIAKDKISAKNTVIDLSPLKGHSDTACFCIEISKPSAKKLNGRVVDIVFDAKTLQHTIAYEGNPYRIAADFKSGDIKAIY